MKPLAAFALLCALTAPGTARAFCGFYAGSATGELTASASRVVLLRDETRTVLTMQNHYEGPPQSFALVVPVPTVIQQDQVRALDPEVFDHIDLLTAPRIVEYRQSPSRCVDRNARHARAPRIRTGNANTRGVTVEAAFSTAEFDIVVLSAGDSTGLETWLRDHGYAIPEGAADALRPYVAAGTRFFVARVDVSRVRFVDGRAVLSPLRVHYDSPDLTLPVRLGVLNSAGEQDLIVYVIGRSRFEVANRRRYFAPTNVEVTAAALPPAFEPLYEHLFDRMMATHPDSVITEYAWTLGSCDPCPGGLNGLPIADLNALGGDVVSGTTIHREGALDVHVEAERRSGRGSSATALANEVERIVESLETRCFGAVSDAEYEIDLEARLGRGGLLAVRQDREGPDFRRCVARQLNGARVHAPPLNVGTSTWDLRFRITRAETRRQDTTYGFTVTRLRTRIRKEGRIDDLVFRSAPAVTGGRAPPEQDGQMSQHATARGNWNTFQSRFVVLHRAEEPECGPDERLVYGGWYGRRPPPPDPAATPSTDYAAMVRSPIQVLGEGRRNRRRRRASHKRVAHLGPSRSALLVGP